MRSRLTIVCALLCLFALCGPSVINAQVIAGIRANGRILNNGDTVRVCQGRSIIYQSVAQGSLLIEWIFQGGLPNTGTGINPAPVFYHTAGITTTWQKITGGGFSDSMYLVVQVADERPQVNFTHSPDSVCGHVPIHFSNLSTGDKLSFLWTFSPAATSTEANPVHPFLEATGLPGLQTFPVKLVATNAYGCKDSSMQTVTVKRVPDASVGNADPMVTYGIFNGIPTFKKCNNIPAYTFRFTNASTTIANNSAYLIRWGDGSPDSAFSTWPAGDTIQHTFSRGSNMMTVEITGTDGCTGIKTYTVFIGSTPAGGLASSGNSDICSSDSLRFFINDVNGNPPGTLYSFFINDGSPQQTFLHSPPSVVSHYFQRGSCGNTSNNGISTFNNAFGAYLTITNPCGTTSPSIVPIYVSGKPRALISLPAPAVCVNTAVTIISNSQYGSVVNQINGMAATCVNTGKQVWRISPATGYTISNGTLGSLNGSNTNGAGWTSGSPSFTVRFTQTGTYSIKIYVYNDRCGLDSTLQTVCVRNAPQAGFIASNYTLCGPGQVALTNTSLVGSCFGEGYTWNVRYDNPQNCDTVAAPAFTYVNETTSTSASPVIKLNQTGRYIVRLTVAALNAVGSCSPVYREDTIYVKGLPKVSITPIPAVCVNNAISPVATGVACYSTGPFKYEWTFTNGSPASAADALPGSITYSSTGTFPIQLKVTDLSCNLSVTDTTAVTIIDKPVADAGTDKAVCSGETVAIGATGIEGITYAWSPAPGFSNAGISNPTVTLEYTGLADDTTYGFKLTATAGSNCINEDSVYITVKRKVGMRVQPASGEICIGQAIQLRVTGGTHYTWTPAATLDNPTADVVTATPTIATIYQVNGLLSNGCKDSVQVPILVNPDAKAQFSAPGTVLCSPVNLDTIIQVTTFPAGNGIYHWYVNDVPAGSNTTGSAPVYAVTTAGQTLAVQLVVQSSFGCKADSMEMTFQTAANVLAGFTKTKKNGCTPLLVDFNNTSTTVAGVQFFWDFGNGITSTQAQPGAVAFHAGPAYNDTAYYVLLKAFNGCDTTYYRDSVKVFASPKARFGVDHTAGCSPFRARIRNTSPGHYTAFYWDFGDGQRDTTYTTGYMDHVYYTGNISTFIIRLIAENQCGRDTQHITLLVSPNTIEPQVTVNGNQLSGCAPHTAVFNNNSLGAGQLTWHFGDGTPAMITPNTQNNVTHTFAQPGNYTVAIELKNNCTDTTILRQVTVYAAPVASFVVNNSPVCGNYALTTTNTSQNAQSYEWIWGDGQITSSLHGSHQYVTSGMYTVQLVARSVNNLGIACTDTAARPVIVADMMAKPVIKVSPALVQVQPDYTFGFKDSIAGSPNKIYDWNMGDFTRQHRSGREISYRYSDTGTYTVKLVVKDYSTGCQASDSVQVTILYLPGYLQVPNAICPGCHQTGLRQFLPMGKGLSQYRLRIFNGWGQLVFESTSLDVHGSPNQGWDGRVNGQPVQQDSYQWQIEAKYKNGTEWKGMLYPGSNKYIKAGFVTVMK